MTIMKALISRIFAFLTNRIFILLLVFIGLYAVLFNKLFVLQIEQGALHNKDFILSIVKYRELEGQRGNIYDRNGYPLAENVIAYKVLLDGSINVDDVNQMIMELVNIIEDSGDEIITTLPIAKNEDGNFVFTQTDNQIYRFKKSLFLNNTSDVLEDEESMMTAENVYLYLRDELFEIPTDVYTDDEILKILNVRFPLWLNRYTQFRQETIALNINEQTLARIEENIGKFPGVTIIENPLRIYNDALYFSHIIGYTGRIDATTLEELESQGYGGDDIVGKIGIEQKMEVYLRGTDGTQTVEVDNLGRTMQIIDTVEPSAGKDVYLTIDHDLQIQCYQILENKLAFLLQSTLAYRGVTDADKDDNVTLMKDVFKSLFNSGIISVEMLEASSAEESQNSIYQTFINRYNDTVADINLALSEYTTPTDEDLIYYKYILEKLNEEGILLDGYNSIETYETKYSELFEKKLSLKELLEIYSNTSMISPPNNADTEISIYENVQNYIQNNVLTYNSFKRSICVKLADEEKFSYSKLCLTLVEQNRVTATEEQIAKLNSNKADPLGFMKEKISKLEITPQQLALDPCSGSIVITDVNSGEVLAMVSYPSYDNNLLVNNFNYDYYTDLLEDPTTPLYPRATQSKIAPGSTFKMVTAIAGMEEEVMRPDEKFTCLGIFQKISPPARCWIYAQGGTHGSLTIPHALEVSCNYFYYEVGYRLSKLEDGTYDDSVGIEKLQKYAGYVGLDEKTGLEIDEAESTLPTHDSVRAAIGQTNNSYTPVQLSRYVSTIANSGNLYELNIVDKVMTNDGQLYYDKTPQKDEDHVYKEDTLSIVQEGMQLVTFGSRGTVRSVFKNYPIKIAGKTGTAQQASTRPDHAIFVGYAPYDKPEVSVVVVIPFGYGSSNAGATAKDVFSSYYELDEVEHGEFDSVDFMIE